MSTERISGNDVCSLLQSANDADVIWMVKAVETLTNQKAETLGELWKRTQTGVVRLSTKELCDILKQAHQIITLDIRKESNGSAEILIEDGVILKNSIAC